MLRILIAAMLTAVALATSASPAAAPAKRPNIIIMMADDMGFSDLGCYGSEIQTPNIDRLAYGGIRFSQFYNGARCCPTRAALLTGLYCHQAGVGFMVGHSDNPAYLGYLNDRCVTIAEVLGQSGYHTLMTGKWHVGEDRPHWPCDRGFEHYFGLISGASSYFELDKGRQMAVDNEPWQPPTDGSFYMTDAIGDNAVKFIDQYGREDKPFFMYVAFTSPHWPVHAKPDDISKYRGTYKDGWDALRERRHKRQIDMGIVKADWPLTPRDETAPPWSDVKDKEAQDLRMAAYAAQIDRMDQNVGKILDQLREMGIEDNTLILFLADNGGCAEAVNRGKKGAEPGTPESYMAYGLPWANASNTPFRLYKHWTHEGGISTPLIAYWHNRIKQPAITHQVGHLIDLMATCVDVAGAKYPSEYKNKPITPLEGQSLLPILEGKQREPHEAIYWEHEGNRAVRMGKWKLVSRQKGTKGIDGWELYDMEADRTELKNLASEQPDRAKTMAAKWQAWAARVGVLPRNQVKE